MKPHLVVALAFCAVLGRAQTLDPCDTDYEQKLKSVKAATTAEELNRAVDKLVHVGLAPSCFSQFAAARSVPLQRLASRDFFKSVVAKFEGSRTDKQAGAGPGSNGTTSLVERGVTAKALGIATEYGALTESVKGQVVTVRGNLDGLPALLARKDLFPYCDPRFEAGSSCINADTLRWLRRISFSVSLDASRDSTTATGASTNAGATGAMAANPVPVVLRANQREISSISGRFELINKRDLTSKTYQDEWRKKVPDEKKLKQAADALTKEMSDVLTPIVDSSEYKEWEERARATLKEAASGSIDQMRRAWTDLLTQLIVVLRRKTPDLDQRIAGLKGAFQTFDLTEDEFVDSLAVKPVLTLEYVNNRPVAQSPVSIVRLIGEFGWATNNTLTFNAAAGFYDNAQPPVNGKATSRWRDVEFGLQFEHKLGELSILGPAALDVTGYFQNQRSPSILNVDPSQPLPGITFIGLPDGAKQVFAEKGNIGIAQLKLVLGPGNTNVRVPVAVSWSNRTELVNKSAWRAQIGISYDFDALFAK